MLKLPLAEFADEAAIRYFSLGRHALVAGLRVLGIGPGDAVLLPAFICRDLLASVHAVGATAAFYAVDRQLAPQALPSLAGVKAVLAVNYFGFPQDLEPFRAYCAEHGAALIEDNAHGFLGRDPAGRLLGCRGDLGIFSLRKTYALPDGAALWVRPGLNLALPVPLPPNAAPLSLGFRIKSALRRVQNASGLPLRSLAEGITRQIRRWRTGHALPLPLPEAESEIPGAAAIHEAALGRLAGIDPKRDVERRRGLYEEFRQRLAHLDIEPVFPDLPAGTAPYGYPFRATAGLAAAVTSIANRAGFDCSYWPDLPDAVAPDAPDFYRNVWWVNFLC